MRSKTAIAVLLLAASFAFAQNTNMNVNQTRRSADSADSGEKKKAPEPTAQERKRAQKLLESSEAAVRSMDPGTQAMALVQMSKAYSTTDKKKAVELLKDAMRQSQEADFGGQQEAQQERLRERIQQKVLAGLMQLDPSAVESMVGEVDESTKKVILKALLDHYQENKEDEKAIDTLEQLTALQEMPYRSAEMLMSRMSNDDSLEFRRLFTDALNSFEQRDDPKQLHFGDSFMDLIVKFHSKLPPELVRQAIDAVLTHAKTGDELAAKAGNSAPTISIASAKGSAQFNSRYDVALSNLYPTIVSVDPSYAERLLKENRESQLFLAKYPQGLPSLTQADASGNNSTSVMINDGAPSRQGGGGGGGGRGGPGAMGGLSMNPADMQLFAKLEGDAAAHPQDVLASIPLLSTPMMQCAAYVGLAHETLKKDTTTAKTALRKATDLIPKLPPDEQVRDTNQIATLYQRMGDNENAKASIEKAMSLAGDVYKMDANAEDPNAAPKWFWPSTAAWRSSMVVATRLDPAWANGLLKDIPDDDIRALNQLAIASESLKIPMRLVEVMEFHKDGNNRVMISQSDGDN